MSKFYTIDGREYPRVTSIISDTLAAPALARWGQKMVAEAAWEYRERLADADEAKKNESVKWLAGAPFRHRDKAAFRGTNVHHMIQQSLLGFDPDLSDASEFERQAFENWRTWMTETGGKVEAAELTVYSPWLGYAGTLDALIQRNGVLVLTDWKTGKPSERVWSNQQLQLAAYAGASQALTGRNGAQATIEMPDVDAAQIVYVRPDGITTADLDAEALVAAEVAFGELLAVWKWLEGLK